MNDKNILEKIFFELAQCREDERSSQNQILQTVSAAGAVLTVIFGASFFDNTQKTFILGHSIRFYLLLLTDLIFLVAIFNITTLGISGVLRFHYIRYLEDKLSELTPDQQNRDNFISWMSYTSSVTFPFM